MYMCVWYACVCLQEPDEVRELLLLPLVLELKVIDYWLPNMGTNKKGILD